MMRHRCANCEFSYLNGDAIPCVNCSNDHDKWVAAGTVTPQSGPVDSGDPVNRPEHYTQGGIECIDAIRAAVTGLVGMDAVCTGHIIRYVWRWKYKNGLEDLKKARFYLDALIKDAEVPHD